MQLLKTQLHYPKVQKEKNKKRIMRANQSLWQLYKVNKRILMSQKLKPSDIKLKLKA